MLSAFTRSTRIPIGSCSSTCSVRHLSNKFNPKQALRQRDWRTAKAYPAPEPLIPKNLASIPGFETLSRQNVVTHDEDSIDLSEEDDEPVIPKKPVTKLSKYEPDPEKDEWKRHAAVMKKSFPDGWQPPKKLSRDAMDGLRLLHKQNPDVFTTPILAEKFRISPEAVRRILKSKWEPSRERRQQMAMREKEEIQERSRAEYLEEAKSRIEALAQKKEADKQESDRYWLESGRPVQERIQIEKRKSKKIRKAWLERQAETATHIAGHVQPPQDEGKSKRSSRDDLFFS